MENRVTALTRRPEPVRRPQRSGPSWAGVLLVTAGIAFGYLLAEGTTGPATPVEDVLPAPVTSLTQSAAPTIQPVAEPPEAEIPAFSETVLASVAFGRRLVTWPGGDEPVEIRLTAEASDVAYNAVLDRIAVTFPGFAGDGQTLHIGTLGDLRVAVSGVVGFAWHPTDPAAIAWVEETEGGYSLVRATLARKEVTPQTVAKLATRAHLVAWGAWGFALQSEGLLTTISPAGDTIATGDLQLVAAGSDGRFVVARPAGTPLSSDWALTGPDLRNQQSLGRFGDLDEHPTAAAVLPESGRIILVSNRFGDEDDLARIEVLARDGRTEAVFRSGMIGESVAWSPDEATLAIGGYYAWPQKSRSVVLLAATDGSGEAVEVPFDHQVRPLGVRP